MSDEFDARIERVEEAVVGINESLKLLSKLEERHQNTADGLRRAFVEIKEVQERKADQHQLDDHEARLRTIEADMPLLREIKRWVIAGVLGIIALVGIALVSLVVVSARKDPFYQPVQQQQRTLP